MSLWRWYKNDWRGDWTSITFGRLAEHARLRFLRHRALNCKDDRQCLKAARLLRDPMLLKRVALTASSRDVRVTASSCIDHPAFLAAIALDTRDVEQGRDVISRIPYDLLLRRIARSAREESVRLLAAEKLDDVKVLKKIARSTDDPAIRWRVARQLSDPELLAEVALYNPGAGRSDAIRHEAHSALLAYLDQLARHRNTGALLSFLWAQPHLPFILDAFLRLPDESIQRALLQHLARQKYDRISHELIRMMLVKIQNAGWRLNLSFQVLACLYCSGKGVLLKSAASASIHGVSNRITCSDCNGTGEKEILKAVCIGDDNHQVVFHLPPSAALRAIDPY